MQSLFDPTSYQMIISRMEQLKPNSVRQWGTMDAAQMLCHCKGPLQVGLGEKELSKPNAVIKTLMGLFKSSLYNDKPWKQGLPTSKEYVVTDAKDFAQEKTELQQLIADFHQLKAGGTLPVHPVFGEFTKEQWGQMQYKHLDHHFRQFGV